MKCQVCGDTVATYRAEKIQSLCESCDLDTPRKVNRTAFDRAYWRSDSGETWKDVPVSIRREFYSDYLTSAHTVREYIRATGRRDNH